MGRTDTPANRYPAGSHEARPDDPYWRRYITGQHELARLSAAEIARKLPLPPGRATARPRRRPRLVLRGLCRRHPGLPATVLDLPGSAAVGREIAAAASLTDRVLFRDGDVTAADLATWHGYDAVLCFIWSTTLIPAGSSACSAGPRRAQPRRHPGRPRRIRGACRRAAAAATSLALFVYLSSGAQVHTPAQLRGWLRDAGFRPRGASACCASQGCPWTWPRSSYCWPVPQVPAGPAGRPLTGGAERPPVGRQRSDDRVEHLRVRDGHALAPVSSRT